MFLFSILLIGMFSFVLAQEEQSPDDVVEEVGELDGFPKAYDCLENLVKERGYSDLTSEEISFAILALGYDSGIQGELRSALADVSYENRCWPSDDCSIKETALASIALEHINQPTNIIESWLIEKADEPSELSWFLQIDTNEATSCVITYNSGSKNIKVLEDKRITGAGGSCLRSAYNGFWLEVDNDCYDESFEVTCESDFVTSLVYRKRAGAGLDSPYFVSSTTHSAPADGKTQEDVNSLCFTEEGSSSCDYEGTLWASLALKKLGKDNTPYIPYLIAMAPNNERHLPSSFLYMLTGDDEYFTELINEQKTDGYWQASSDSNERYFDTALALLAVPSSEHSSRAVDWLLETQQSSGCWRNAKDTSFILYSASPKTPALSSERADCSDFGGYCVSSEQTCQDAIGEVLGNYYCPSLGSSVCCSVDVQEELPDVIPGGDIEDTNECEERGYYCKAICSEDTEELRPYECSGLQDCCGPKVQEEKSRSLWWVWLLVILIILLILAIIYRNQVKIWVFRVKSKFKKQPVRQQKRPIPGIPPQRPPMRPMPGKFVPGQRPPMRPMQRPPMRQPPRKPGQPFPKENTLQETLKKLREIGRKK